jgi:hypothetical protein
MTVLKTVPTLLSSSTHILAQPGWDINYKETNPFIQELHKLQQTHAQVRLYLITHPRSWWKVGFGNGTNDVKMLDWYSPTVHAPESCDSDGAHILSILNVEFNHRLLHLV